jgi:hypothetical protein
LPAIDGDAHRLPRGNLRSVRSDGSDRSDGGWPAGAQKKVEERALMNYDIVEKTRKKAALYFEGVQDEGPYAL